jgi:SAM-dependent methyltransferase
VTSDDLITRLESSRRLAHTAPASPSWAHRLGRPIRRVLARLLGPQEAFNAAVTDYFTTVVRPLEASQAELRETVGALHHAVRALAQDVAARAAPGTSQAAPPPPRRDHPLSHKYVGFEDRFRGPSAVIRTAQADYLPLFDAASDVLDIGCGRGEFLALLRERGIAARGLDANDAMIALCREQGLDAQPGDALTHLRGQADASIGGLFAAQVVEHLEPACLTQLLDEAWRVLRPGAAIVLETINPACWAAFFESYIRDITHVRPLHPDTLRFLLVASGFQEVVIQPRSPYPDHAKLQATPQVPALGPALDTLNANVARLNGLLFSHMDYAAIGRRP